MSTLQAAADAPWFLHAGATALLVTHIGGGTVAMITGAVAMLARKGGRTHRTAGNVFFIGMLCMAGVGATVSPFLEDGRWTNTFAGAFTLYLVCSAWVTIRRPAGQVGRFERWAVLAPIGLAVVGLALAVVGAQTGRMAGFSTIYALASIAALAAVCDLNLIRRGGLIGKPRMARHVWRMSVSLFVAMGSFFLGQQQVLPEAIRGTFIPVAPVLAVVVLGVFWSIRVRLPRGFRPRPATA